MGPIFTSPAGRIRLLSLTAFTTSIGLSCARQQLVGIDVHHDLAVLSAEGRRNLRALDDRDLIADLELRVVVQLRLVQPLALTVTRHTGRLEASNFSTTGGSVPGGRRFRSASARLEIWVTSASALVPGWK